ncbi:vWA domain-containing protein [Marinobacterium weihaiense]|uniref:VWA domain-containing protein n=1 Tax=Marinobacterium weihaiense TaxID=2851016 RepID=A0ABS6MG90_9GAMM|nr:VWA domain-containing protein [Marinobacterium weihaiense]MBV0934727.1 VWA domain-containing protein [Marinobacterium weihaiense]
MKTTLRDALPILASAYGQQFGVKVQMGGTGAWTNGTTIQLPMISNPDLRDLALGYLVHESAHIRLTDFHVFGTTQGIFRSLVNILEDVRIERWFYENDYPGTKQTLQTVWDHVGSKPTLEEMVQADNVASLFHNYLLYRVRQEQHGLDSTKPHYEAVKQAIEAKLPPGFFIRLDVLLDKHLDSMASTTDAKVLAQAILEALKHAEEEANQEKDQQQDQSESDTGDSQGRSGNDQGSSGDSQAGTGDEQGDSAGQGGSDNGQDGSGNGGESSDTQGQSGNQQGGSDAGSGSSTQPQSERSSGEGDGAGGGSKSLTEQIMSETDLPSDVMEAVRQTLGDKAEEEFKSDPSGVSQAAQLDSGIGHEVRQEQGHYLMGVDSLKDGILASSKLRSQIVGLLQAQTRARRSHREYGSRLDAKRLARAMAGERRIWKHMSKRQMVDTSVHILLDTSSSMGGCQPIANSATVSMALAISAIPKADVAVSIFPGIGAGVSPVTRRNTPVRSNVGRFAVRPNGGTPMAEGMFYAARELSTVTSKRKVMIVITDGAPNDGASVQYINRLVEGEIDVYAIGIRSDAVRLYFRNYEVISGVNQLQSALFSLAQEFLKVA